MTSVTGDGDPTAQLRAEIEQTRRELGQAVEAVAERVDPKAMVHAKVDEAKVRVRQRSVPVVVVVAAGVVVIVAVRLIVRRRSR